MKHDVGVKIYVDQGDWEVWIGPDSDLRGDNIINSFIAGSGKTRDEAVVMAVAGLEEVLDMLQGPPSELKERFISGMTVAEG